MIEKLFDWIDRTVHNIIRWGEGSPSRGCLIAGVGIFLIWISCIILSLLHILVPLMILGRAG